MNKVQDPSGQLHLIFGAEFTGNLNKKLLFEVNIRPNSGEIVYLFSSSFMIAVWIGHSQRFGMAQIMKLPWKRQKSSKLNLDAIALQDPFAHNIVIFSKKNIGQKYACKISPNNIDKIEKND